MGVSMEDLITDLIEDMATNPSPVFGFLDNVMQWCETINELVVSERFNHLLFFFFFMSFVACWS